MKKIILITLIFTTLLAQKIKASHISGAEITYNYIGNNQYRINLKLYWDCTDGFDPGNPQTIDLTSTCGGNLSLSVEQTNSGGTDISQLCASALSTCSGGTTPGMKMNEYTDTITLSPCDTWTMSWSNCCRNQVISNLQNPDNFGTYVEAILNSVTAPTNNSPYFTSQSLPYVCVNQAICYNFGVAEADGDSLYYSLVNAMEAGASNLLYNTGYTAIAPIPGITINPNTGQISFTPTTVGNFVVVVEIAEYTPAGVLIGTVMRDIRFVVFNCVNQTVGCTDGAIGSLTGTATQTGPYTLEMCEGSAFTFDITYTDPNAGDSLTILSNLSIILPGSSLTITGVNPLVATISWTAPAGAANTNTSFSITVKDNTCPVPGQQTFVYDINVLARTGAGADQIICGTQAASLNCIGGNVFTWNVVSGPAMLVGTNFSCNPCASPVASPTSTTTYEVVSDLGGSCLNKDTVTVTVVPDFSFITTQTTDTLCLQQLVSLNITGTPAGAYTQLWSPPTYLDNVTIANPTATPFVPGLYNYSVNITSPLGCHKKDTIKVTVLPEIRTKTGTDTILCLSQSTTLHATGGASFLWSVLSGPAMALGSNFSCNPCANPIATPSTTTVYQVTSNLNGTCINKDTVTVTVVPNFTNTITQSEIITCLLQPPIQLDITTVPAGTYSYVWSPATYLNNSIITNPVANITVPGIHSFVASVTSSTGCVKKDSAIITITPSYAPNPIAYVSENSVCVGDTLQLGVTFGTSIPSVCGTNPIGCSATMSSIIGTGTATNTSSTWPAPYGNWYTSAKHQFLFKATELIAAGLTGGKIDRLDFNVTQINGITVYHQYTINMGCTNVAALTTWIPNLLNVYTPKNHTVISGWNAHPFDNAYEWDGISNVVVEICFTEGPGQFGYSNYSNNSLTPFTTTSFTSCLYRYSDSGPQCPDMGTPQTTSNRPNIKFHYCGGAPDSTNYTYSWFPPAGIFNTNAQTTGAILMGQTEYYVIVTDTVSGCYRQDTISVEPKDPIANFTMVPDSVNPFNYWAFNTSSGNGLSYSWDFGDGSPLSNLISPTHTYASANTYNVCLTITSENCINMLCQNVVINGTLNPCLSLFNIAHDTSSSNPNALTVTNLSYGAALTYLWDFGDNATSILAYPSHTYAGIGPYQLCLTVDNGAGCIETYCDSLFGVDSLGRELTQSIEINVIDGPDFGTTGGLGEEIVNSIKISPNPSSGSFQVLSSILKIENLKIYNVLGEIVFQSTGGYHEATIDLSSEEKGIYFVIMENEKKHVINKKIVIQ